MKKLSIYIALVAVSSVGYMSFAGKGDAPKGAVVSPNDDPAPPPPTSTTYYLARWKPLPPMTELSSSESAYVADQIPNSYNNYTLASLFSPPSYRGWLAFASAACRTEFLNKRVHATGSTYTWSRYYEVDYSHNTTTIVGPPSVLVIACAGE